MLLRNRLYSRASWVALRRHNFATKQERVLPKSINQNNKLFSQTRRSIRSIRTIRYLHTSSLCLYKSNKKDPLNTTLDSTDDDVLLPSQSQVPLSKNRFLRSPSKTPFVLTEAHNYNVRWEAHQKITRLIHEGKLHEALAVAERYAEDNVMLQSSTYNFLLGAAVEYHNSECVERAINLFWTMKVAYNKLTYNHIFTWLSHTNQLQEYNYLWIKLKFQLPSMIDARILVNVLSHTRRHALGLSWVQDVLNTAQFNNIALNSAFYAALVTTYNHLQAFDQAAEVLERYESLVEKGEIVEDVPSIWIQAINTFSRVKKDKSRHFIVRALDAMQSQASEAVWHQCIGYLANTNYINILLRVFDTLRNCGVTPQADAFAAYARVLLNCTLEGMDIETTSSSSESVMIDAPTIMSYINSIINQASQLGVKLNMSCYNFILATLARLQRCKEFDDLYNALRTDPSKCNSRFKLNAIGYAALVTNTVNEELSAEEKLDKINGLLRDAIESLGSTRQLYAQEFMLGTLMCAYAILESNSTEMLLKVAEEMKTRKVTPTHLRSILRGMVGGKDTSVIEKLNVVLQIHWAQLAPLKEQ